MTLADAIAADCAGDIPCAADAYESSLVAEQRNLVGFLNLALLYWQATDFGFSTAKKLDPTFVHRAGIRLSALLAEAHEAFPESTEVQFWRKYIPWADIGEEFSLDECRQLLLKDPTTLVPAMHLFAQTHAEFYRTEAIELLRLCQREGTTRARYIVSVVEGVTNRAGWKGV